MWFNTQTYSLHSSRGQRSRINFTGRKSRCWQGSVLPETLRLSESFVICGGLLGACGPFFHLQSPSVHLGIHHPILSSSVVQSLSLSYKDPCASHVGCTQMVQIIPPSQDQSLITSAKSLLHCKGTLKASGIKTRMSLRDCHSAHLT